MNTVQIQNMVFDEDHRQAFLDSHGFEIESAVGRDSSIRRYFRVRKGDQSAILMESVPDNSPYMTPGHGLNDFVRIDGWLQEAGVKVPEIYEADLQNGYVLLEDLGSTCFRDAIDGGENAKQLYELAQSVLNRVAVAECNLDLPEYYKSHVHKRHRRVVDWFVPLVRGKKNEDGLAEEYLDIWKKIERQYPTCAKGFVHVDFHAQNLMWIPGEEGIKRCGVLDFQGAMHGPLLYDLANLLEDARRDVPTEIKNECLKGLSEEERAWFRILATQFHCRVIGQFIKMAVADDNKMYLKHIPRLQMYLASAMLNPVLKPLANFFDDLGVDFAAAQYFNTIEAEGLISPDAE